MNAFYIVYYIGDIAKGASALLIRITFIANIKYILRLIADKGDLNRCRGRVRIWTFFLHRSLIG